MITDIHIVKFSRPIYVQWGDIVTVTHQVLNGKRVIEDKVVSHEVKGMGVWTHSIMFKLNGHLNHTIGDEKTVEWIRSQERPNV